MSINKKSFIVNSLHGGKKILCDVRYIKSKKQKSIVVFVHGFKGFKDWGHFNLIADKFAEQGYVFVKFNLSHNGTTPEYPLDFVDLEAFGNNNYTIELDDIQVVLNHLGSKNFEISNSEIDLNKIYLIGHSRGGGICIIKASEDNRIKKLVTWASLSRFDTMINDEMLNDWKNKGVIYIYNSRTKQNMPLYYQLAEEFLNNQDRLSIPKRVAKLNIPYLNIHGDKDETVSVSVVNDLKNHNNNMQIHIIKGANHVFGATHPFVEKNLSEHAQEMMDKTLEFLNV